MAMRCLLPQARSATSPSSRFSNYNTTLTYTTRHYTTSTAPAWLDLSSPSSQTTICDTPKVVVMASRSQQTTKLLLIATQAQSAFLSRLPPELRLIIYHFHILDSPSPSPSDSSESSAKSTYYDPNRFRKLQDSRSNQARPDVATRRGALRRGLAHHAERGVSIINCNRTTGPCAVIDRDCDVTCDLWPEGRAS